MAEKRAVGKRGTFPRGLLVLLLGALAVRVLLVATTDGYLYDTNTFSAWAGLLNERGLSGFYTGGFFADYPPGYMFVLWAAGRVTEALGLAALSGPALLVLCLVPVLCDLGLAALLYRVALPRGGRRGALLAAACAAFNPAFIFDCAVWKQVDAVLALLLLACFLLLSKRRYLPAAFFYGLALLVKPQALLYGPVFALGFLLPVFFEKGRARLEAALRTLGGAMVSVGAVIVLSAPFTGSQTPVLWLLEKYFTTASSYPYASINAFNFIAALGGNWKPMTDRFLFLSWQGWGMLGILLVTAALVLLAVRSYKNGRFNLPLLAAFYGCGIFTFAHQMHERYIFPAVVFLLAAWALCGDRRLWRAAALFSATLLVNMAAVYYNVGGDQFLESGFSTFLVRATGLVSTAGFCWLAWLCWRLLVRGEAARPAAAAAGGEKKSVYRVLSPGARRPGPARHLSAPSLDPVPRWARRDTMAILLLTLFTACLSLPYLGTTNVPQNAYTPSGSGAVQVQLQGSGEVASVWVYPGILLPGAASGLVTVAGEDGTVLCEFALSGGSCFSWQVQDVSFPAGRLTVTVAGAPVNEIVFADAAGRALPLGSVSAGGEALFDEQTTLPDRPSQLNGMYFDEIYHGRTGYETLHGLPIYETTHPPLGKDFIALGIALLGMNPLGWRIMGVLFGIAMVPVFYLLARRLLKKFWPVLCVTGLFALDFMRYTQSRIATIDVFVVLFVLLGAYFMLWFCQAYVAGGRKGALLPAALGGVAFGLGCASKWTGVYAGLGLAAVYFLALYGRWRHILSAPGSEADKEITFQRDFRFAIRTGLLFYVAVPLAIYTASYIPLLFEQSGGFTFAGILRSQQVMFSYHSQLTSTHPFESRWYSWPLMLRPVWYYMGSRLPAGTVASIAAFGNPVVWWGGAAALLWLVWRLFSGRCKKKPAAVFLLILFAAQYLPWVFISRATFIYHYFAAMPFALLALGLLLCRLLEARPRAGRAACVGALALAAGLFVFFFPVLSGLPVSTSYAALLKWLPGWGFYIL